MYVCVCGVILKVKATTTLSDSVPLPTKKKCPFFNNRTLRKGFIGVWSKMRNRDERSIEEEIVLCVCKGWGGSGGGGVMAKVKATITRSDSGEHLQRTPGGLASL